VPDYRLEDDDSPQVNLSLGQDKEGNARLFGQIPGVGEPTPLVTLTTDGTVLVHDLDEDFANRAGFIIDERTTEGFSRIRVDRD
jgi:hypothetical protein